MKSLFYSQIKLLWVLITCCFLCHSCNSDEPTVDDPDISIVAHFNTLGVKWGQDQSFSPSGYDIGGPETSGGVVSYSFRGAGNILETHSQSGTESQSFSAIVPCAKEEIRNALNSWSEQSQIEFTEQADSIESDINFFIAPIEQGGVGYPPLSIGIDGNDISGQVIFQPNQNHSCHGFFVFALPLRCFKSSCQAKG